MVLLPVWSFSGGREGRQLVAELFCTADDTVRWASDLQLALGDYYDLDERGEYVRPPHMDDASATEGQHVNIYLPCRNLILPDEIPHDA
jgi:hypothetical protein